MPTSKTAVDPQPSSEDSGPPFALLQVSAVGRTHQGRKRTRNEDRLLLLETHGVYVVADGMGGYVGGQVAAQLAVDAIALAFDAQDFGDMTMDRLPRPSAELVAAYRSANQAVFQRTAADAALRDMATTLVGGRFLPREELVFVAHVGDSRCYRLRDGDLEQLTVDHASTGEPGAGPAGQLTRGVGAEAQVEVDVATHDLRVGDRYLFCSDGLPKMVPKSQIRSVLGSVANAASAADALIQTANARGGKDNVTVVLVDVTRPGVGVVPHDREEEAARLREARERVPERIAVAAEAIEELVRAGDAGT